MLRDIRRSASALLANRGLAVAAVVSLAIGIGTNAAVFSLVDLLFLTPLPVAHPQSLVFVTDERSLVQRAPTFSYPFYQQLSSHRAIDGLAARARREMNVQANGLDVRMRVELVSGNYFDVIGADVGLGRRLTPADDRTRGAHAVAVISDAVWRQRFGSDPLVVGRSLRIQKGTFTIVGVASEFRGMDVGQPTDVWVPMSMQAQLGRDLFDDWRTNWLQMVGRLRPGTTLEGAAAELTAFVQTDASLAMGTEARRRRIVLLSAGTGSSAARTEAGPALRALAGMTTLALVLACVNVANLLLIRSAAREKEIAIQLALGASRLVLARQTIFETLLLTGVGGLAGLLLAPWGARLLVATQQLQLEPRLDVRVFAFALGASTVTALVVALAPVWSTRTIGVEHAWATSARGSVLVGRSTVRDLITVLQIAASLALLIGAALLTQTVKNLRSIDPGFQSDNLLLISIDPKSVGYDAHRIDGFWRDVLGRIALVPGVARVSLAHTVPLAPGRQRQKVLDAKTGNFTEIDTNFVAPDYFKTLQVPLLRGREFDTGDRRGADLVAIVNETLARQFWPGEEAVGQQLQIKTAEGQFHRIVGVVKDARYRTLAGEAGPMVYRPLLQTMSTDAMTLHVRAAADPETLVSTIRTEIHLLDQNVPLFSITTLQAEIEASFAQTHQAAALATGFGLVALVLSAIGVYGVTGLMVSRHTRNIGIRMAFGASAGSIIGLVSRRGAAVVAIGLAAGLLASYGITKTTESLLVGVTPSDVSTVAGMSALLGTICLLAILVAARNATRLDPLQAIQRD